MSQLMRLGALSHLRRAHASPGCSCGRGCPGCGSSQCTEGPQQQRMSCLTSVGPMHLLAAAELPAMQRACAKRTSIPHLCKLSRLRLQPHQPPTTHQALQCCGGHSSHPENP